MSHDFRSKFLSAIDRVIAPPTTPAAARGLQNVITRLQAKQARIHQRTSGAANAPLVVLPSPTPAAGAPLARPAVLPAAVVAASHAATHGEPSTPLLRSLAIAIFGKGEVEKEVRMPAIQVSEEARALLTANMHNEWQHRKDVARYDAEVQANTPSATEIEKFEREKLTELFYRTGLSIPGLSFAGMQIHGSQFGKCELTESQRKEAQGRVDEFFKVLSGERLHTHGHGAHAAVEFLKGGNEFSLLTVPTTKEKL